MKTYYVYIMASDNKNTIYTGITNNLERRTFEHKNPTHSCFSQKYHCKNLVYYEYASDVNAAIEREKQIKNYSRAKKISLIESMNKNWKDLSEDFYK